MNELYFQPVISPIFCLHEQGTPHEQWEAVRWITVSDYQARGRKAVWDLFLFFFLVFLFQ